MFCPKCRMEYRGGFTECSDCETRLVEELPPLEEENHEIDEPDKPAFVQALETFSQGEIAFLKSILEDKDIHYYFKTENFSSMEPVQPARLMVARNDIGKVQELLKDHDVKYMGLSDRRVDNDDNEED